MTGNGWQCRRINANNVVARSQAGEQVVAVAVSGFGCDWIAVRHAIVIVVDVEINGRVADAGFACIENAVIVHVIPHAVTQREWWWHDTEINRQVVERIAIGAVAACTERAGIDFAGHRGGQTTHVDGATGDAGGGRSCAVSAVIAIVACRRVIRGLASRA